MRHPSILKSSTCAAARGSAWSGLFWLLLILFPAVAQADESPSAVAMSATALTSGCADCHGVDGLARENLDAPVIAGMPATLIEEAIYAYRDGARQCRYEPLMCEIVLHIDHERIADLAEHYASQRRGPSNEPYDLELAIKGGEIHDRFCGRCHLKPEDPFVEDALGIPLHGQRAVYLRYALKSYKDGRRKNLMDNMAEKLDKIDADDIEALVNYYASY